MGCYEFWRDLKRGDHGDDVRELQQRLAHEDPTLFPPGLVNGFFGPKTEASLKMLQRRFGISAFDGSFTGFFGKKSRDYMKSQCSGGDADKDGIRNSEDPDDDNDGILDLQDSKPFSNASTTEAKKEKKSDDDNDRNRGRGNDDRDGDDD